MRIEDVTDLDWYIDNVVVPSGPENRPVGPVRAWQGAWDALAYRLSASADDTAVGKAVRLALTQGFILTKDDVRRCGISDASFRSLVRRGTWRPVGRGCIAVIASEVLDDDTHQSRRRDHVLRAAAAVRKRRGHHIAGASAAILRGLPVMSVPSVPELISSPGATFGRLPAARVRQAQLAPADACDWFGAPVTAPARTIVDLARADARSGLMAADAALREALIDQAQLNEVTARAVRLAGIRRAREVLALADALIESPLESLTHLALHDSGFPPPKLQRWINTSGGKRYRVDFLWPEYRLIVEADGRGKNSEAERWREKKRDIALERAGYRVVRVTWADVVHNWPAVERWLRELMSTDQTG